MRLIAAMIVLAANTLAGSFSINSFFNLQVPTGSLVPLNSDSSTERFIEIYDSSQSPSPILYVSGTGVPAGGETNSLSNLVNNASYLVTAATFLPSLASYGITAQGSFADASQIGSGFGPVFTTELGFSINGLGVLSSLIDDNLVVSGPNDASVLFLTLSQLNLIVDLRGSGQATVQQSQLTVSGSDYVLALGYTTGLPSSPEAYVKVVGGVITDESVLQGNTLTLPSIGSSGNFTIPLSLGSVPFNQGGIDEFALTFNDGGGIYFPPQPIPEPRTNALVLFGCALLMLVRASRDPFATTHPEDETSDIKGATGGATPDSPSRNIGAVEQLTRCRCPCCNTFGYSAIRTRGLTSVTPME